MTSRENQDTIIRLQSKGQLFPMYWTNLNHAQGNHVCCINHFEDISFVFFSCFNAYHLMGVAGVAQWWKHSPPTHVPIDSRSQRHMWVAFVLGSRHCSEGFSPGTLVFLPPQKTNIFKFQFDLVTVERRATSMIPLKFLFILFIYLICREGS